MTQEIRSRIGIMGGTFDPIHIGHLILAECAYEQFKLDRIQFLPAGNPPHKTERTDGATDEERLEMVALAIRDNPHFVLDAEEMYRTGFSYTSDTLRMLRTQNPNTEYYFIIGADSLMSFDTWRNPEIICENCVLLAAVRDNLEVSVMEVKMEQLRRQYGAEIYLLHSPNIDVSSTELRLWHQEGHSLRYYVPDQVLDYITINGIYSKPPMSQR